MQDLNTGTELLNYNDIPVFYCKQCLSLRILNMEDEDFCDECGNTDLDSCHISEWEKLYEEKYGHKYLQKEVKFLSFI